MRGRQFPGIHPVAVSISYVYSDRTEVTQIIPPSPSSSTSQPADPPRSPTMPHNAYSPPPQFIPGKQTAPKSANKVSDSTKKVPNSTKKYKRFKRIQDYSLKCILLPAKVGIPDDAPRYIFSSVYDKRPKSPVLKLSSPVSRREI